MKKKSNFIVQGSILAIAGILARIIGIARRFPMQHIIGDIGNGYYAAAYEVYYIILIISCYSLPLAVSKVVSAKVSKKQYKNAKRAFWCAMVFALTVGSICFALVEIFGTQIATNLVLEPMSAMALKVLSPAFLIVAVMGVFRGYFQGLGSMIPTAISQIIEQVFVVVASVAGAYFFFSYGEKVGAVLHDTNYAPAYGAAGASLGPVLGAFVGLIFLVFVYVLYQKTARENEEKDITKKTDSYAVIAKLMLLTILPVLLSSTVYNISGILDIRIYNSVMIQKGLEDVKAANWGVYSGKYKVLINLPVALANAMCSSIVPVLAGLVAKEEYKEARKKIDQGMRFTMLISIPCAVGLAVLARPMITLLFTGEIDLAVQLLHFGSISVVFISMSTLSNGILQGINKLQLPVIHALIALAAHIACLYLVLELDWGVIGVVLANLLFFVIVCVLNWISIKKHFHYRQEISRTFIIPTISSALMGLTIVLVSLPLEKLLSGMSAKLVSAIILLVGFVLGVIVYFSALLVMKGIPEEDLKKMPGGKVVVKIAKKVNLLK